MRNVLKLSERELQTPSAKSWHDMYRDSAWIFIAGFPYTLSEGDIVCVFSQYGEVVNINLVRDSKTGKSKGFCFLCYEDQRSTVLAVDNLNGIKIIDRTLRVDHVQDYKPPKDNDKLDEETLRLYMEGCAPKPISKDPTNPFKEPERTHVMVENIKKEKDKTKRSHKSDKEKRHKKRRDSSD